MCKVSTFIRTRQSVRYLSFAVRATALHTPQYGGIKLTTINVEAHRLYRWSTRALDQKRSSIDRDNGIFVATGIVTNQSRVLVEERVRFANMSYLYRVIYLNVSAGLLLQVRKSRYYEPPFSIIEVVRHSLRSLLVSTGRTGLSMS